MKHRQAGVPLTTVTVTVTAALTFLGTAHTTQAPCPPLPCPPEERGSDETAQEPVYEDHEADRLPTDLHWEHLFCCTVRRRVPLPSAYPCVRGTKKRTAENERQPVF